MKVRPSLHGIGFSVLWQAASHSATPLPVLQVDIPELLGLFDTWADPEHPEEELKLKTRPQVRFTAPAHLLRGFQDRCHV